MISVLRNIEGDKIKSLNTILKVIEMLEKDFTNDKDINTKDWNVVTNHLIRKYGEIKSIYIKEVDKTEKINKIRFLLDLWNDPDVENMDDDVSKFIKNKLNELGVKDNEIYK